MKKRILLIDDQPENWLTVDMLRSYLSNVRFSIGRDLYDADSYVYDEGIIFDRMIIDFALGEYTFDDPDDQAEFDALGSRKYFLAGWVWIKHFLRDHPSYKPERIIGVSAYTDFLSKQEIEEAGIRVIDKRDRDSIERLLEAVQ